MTSLEIARTLEFIRPGAVYVMYGTSYDGLKWLDQTQTMPTEKEITDGFNNLPNDKKFPPSIDQVLSGLDARIKALEISNQAIGNT